MPRGSGLAWVMHVFVSGAAAAHGTGTVTTLLLALAFVLVAAKFAGELSNG